LFKRCRIKNVDNVIEGRITFHEESRTDPRWHWYDHFFNSRFKRMFSIGIGDTSPSTMGVKSREYCSGASTVSIKGGIICREKIDALESERLLGEPQASGIAVVAGHR
jgi:hypothetical protein